MPIYEYLCEKCGHQFDELQKISDKPLKKCPECGRNSLTKLVSAAGFRLKGGGWYETDFKSGNKKNLAQSDGSSSKDSDSSAKSSSGGSDSGSSSASSSSSSSSSSKKKGDNGKAKKPASKKGGGSSAKS